MSERPVEGPALSGAQAEQLSALFDAHWTRLYRLARRLVSSADDALDLVQETFLRAARSSSAIPREPTAEEAWLVRVLVNIRRDQWRRERTHRRHQFESSGTTARHDDPEESLLIRTAVWRALDRLPPRRRAVVVMREIEGLAFASIASLLGISAITVRWHLVQGRRELARQLERELGETNAPQHRTTLAGRRSGPSRSTAP